jgi:hypothetical protein
MRVRGVLGLSSRLLFVVVFFAALINYSLQSTNAQAAQITTRSLTLQAGAGGDGGSMPGGTVNHLFSFTLPTGGDVGSIKFEYCTVAQESPSQTGCTGPTGLDASSALLGTETGATGFDSTPVVVSNNVIYLTRTPANVSANQQVTYQITGVVNPTTANQTFFARISTYTSSDTTGNATDKGSVAASTANQIVLTGIVPESIIFCTGASISTSVGGIPDCNTATSGNIEFPDLFSPSATIATTSQMAASTNATGGYIITVNGSTLTSGTNTIQALDTAGASVIGTGQFGLNLTTNTTPTIGTDVLAAPDGTDLRGQAVGDYATPDLFKFVSGDTVASSTNGGAGPTNAQIFTVSYIVNVPGNQVAGEYRSTLTYICTATF